MPIALAPFDSSRDFIAQTSFRAGGVIWQRKKPFDKSFVNARVLEQLYNQRKLAYAPFERKRSPLAGVPSSIAEHARRFVDSILAHTRTLTPREAHSEAVAEEQAEDNGASGTAREAPGVEESTSAQSGEASAPAIETVEGAAHEAAPPEAEAAAAPVGDAATAAATDRDQAVERLMIDNSQSQLFEKAKDLPNITVTTSKKALAEALVDAGRTE